MRLFQNQPGPISVTSSNVMTEIGGFPIRIEADNRRIQETLRAIEHENSPERIRTILLNLADRVTDRNLVNFINNVVNDLPIGQNYRII